MRQKYNSRSNSDIPNTRIISWAQFRGKRNTTIKAYLLELLASCDAGMTCREISTHSDIWVQSLTSPLKNLLNEGKIVVIGIKKSSVSNRLVQVYGISILTK